MLLAWALGTMRHRGHSPSLGFCPAERRSVPTWHWSDLWASACHSPPMPCPRAEPRFCKRKEFWQERICVPTLAARVSQQEDAASAVFCAGCTAPALQHCQSACTPSPRHSPRLPVLLQHTLKAWWLCQANALSSETQWHQGKVEDVQWRQ